MISIRRSVSIERSPRDVFGLISDPRRYPEFLVGISRWEPKSSKRRGRGARYRVLMKVGAAEVGGLVEVVEWRQGKSIAWASERGLDHRGQWSVLPTAGGTRLELEIEYDLPGPGGWLVERIASRPVGRNMSATLLTARRILEHEDMPRAKRSSGTTRRKSSDREDRTGRARARRGG